MRTITTFGDVRQDHTVLLVLPTDVPPGRVRVTVTIDEPSSPSPLSPQEFLKSELFGIFADREDLPSTNEEFREWRRKISAE